MLLLAPRFAGRVFTIMVVSFAGELSCALWLLIKGVGIEGWRPLAAVPAT